MRKNGWENTQMSSVEYVERAAWWSKELARFRARGPGDTENAMRAIGRDYAIDYWLLWRLRYRAQQIKDIGVSVYARLEAAYRSECERQHARLAHELNITRAIVGPDHKVVRAVEAVVGKANAEEGDA